MENIPKKEWRCTDLWLRGCLQGRVDLGVGSVQEVVWLHAGSVLQRVLVLIVHASAVEVIGSALS